VQRELYLDPHAQGYKYHVKNQLPHGIVLVPWGRPRPPCGTRHQIVSHRSDHCTHETETGTGDGDEADDGDWCSEGEKPKLSSDNPKVRCQRSTIKHHRLGPILVSSRQCHPQ
jgi:hypothetical protein